MPDPLPHQINPDIVELGKRLGSVRLAIEVYLQGLEGYTWQKCLETMVLLLGKEVVAANSAICHSNREANAMRMALDPKKRYGSMALLSLNPIVNDNGVSYLTKMPAGWRVVDRGATKRGDQFWNAVTERWHKSPKIGDKVSKYVCVIRKEKKKDERKELAEGV